MEYQDDNSERKRKIRIIAGTCVAAVLVLGVGAWLIIAAISGINTPEVARTSETTSTEKTPENNTKSSSAKKEKTTSSESSSETSSETTASNASDSSASTAESASVAAATEVPATGPSELIATALLAGVAVYLLGLNRNLAKSRA